MMLHSNEWQSQHTYQAGHTYAVSSDMFMFEKLGSGNLPLYYRIFAGITAWQPGQLHAEVNGMGPYTDKLAWLLADPNDDIIFGTQGQTQYVSALELCGQQMYNQYI